MGSNSKKKLINSFKARLREQFNSWINEVNVMLRDGIEHYKINNKLCDIRNKCCDFLDLCLFEITSEFKHGKAIKGELRSGFDQSPKSYGKPCQICGETRVYNVCHVVPLSEGGQTGNGNVIILCPTHHFLFDHSRLSKGELEKIDKSGLFSEAQKYLETIHTAKHEMRWKYKTNRFKGCDCGSKDFLFKCHRTEHSVRVALECNKCHEIWTNVWEEMHPISLLKTEVFDLNIPKYEVENILDAGEKKIMIFLNNDLNEMLETEKYL
jgi:hypothetical protein